MRRKKLYFQRVMITTGGNDQQAINVASTRGPSSNEVQRKLIKISLVASCRSKSSAATDLSRICLRRAFFCSRIIHFQDLAERGLMVDAVLVFYNDI